MSITKVKELIVRFRGSMIRVYDIEYDPGVVGRLSGPPEDCYPEEPEFIEYQVESGNTALDNILENDSKNEFDRDVIRKLSYEKLI